MGPKPKPAEGVVLSVGPGRFLADGTIAKVGLEPGDSVLYNPHLVAYEVEYDGKETIVIGSNAIYGRYK